MTEEQYRELDFDEKQINLLLERNTCNVCHGIGHHLVIDREKYLGKEHIIAVLCPFQREYNEYTKEKLKKDKQNTWNRRN